MPGENIGDISNNHENKWQNIVSKYDVKDDTKY